MIEVKYKYMSKNTTLRYYPRYIEKEIERKLRSSGAIVVAGPKFCGKTTTCMWYGKSSIQLNTAETIRLAKLQPKSVLSGEKPRLIDEWQTVPDIWSTTAVTQKLVSDFSLSLILTARSARPTPEFFDTNSSATTVIRLTAHITASSTRMI